MITCSQLASMDNGMDNGKKIPYVTKCLHLSNSISTTGTQRSLINNAIADLNIKSNILLAEFSFSNFSTLSVLFKSYCMNIYGSTLWRYNNHSNIDNFCVSWRKIVRQFVFNLFNSDNVLFMGIIRYSMHISDTTIGENVRYFMYKYRIVYDDWFNDRSNIFNRIDNQLKNITQLDAICLAGAIRELCKARDSGFVQFVDRNQICNMHSLTSNSVRIVVYKIASCYLYKIAHIYPFVYYFSFIVLLFAYYVILFHVRIIDINNN